MESNSPSSTWYIQRLLANTVFGRQEGGKARKDELFMIHQMLHAQPIDTGAFLITQMKDLANKKIGGGGQLCLEVS